ncbi:YceD family protein [Magnetovibrio blakemorei]|uniref:Metal-binding protein n=1 Tax=Magnetovibrio blakemorei TaxID=28181 RepID=A0A1E5Q406_9PROT|nr:DUF177 domain-containing protein [Magnetovibrio blakemorei]OEJ64618.1 hypothetical protein BEN30_00540 [Magnetovibrio blakemorei]
MSKISPQDQNVIVPEWSRIVRVDKLGAQLYSQDIKANADELRALTRRLKVDEVENVSAHVSVQLMTSGDVLVKASFQARVTQTCGVTLEPIVSDISSDFKVTYTENGMLSEASEEEEIVGLVDDFDPPEELVDGKIDIAEAVIEHLALELDPFPRVKGATFDGYSSGSWTENEPITEKKNPFEVLAQLKVAPKSST